MKEKLARLFRTGGSVAVRIPREWVPDTDRVILRKEGNTIIISDERQDLLTLARRFEKDGPIEFERPAQPKTPKPRSL